MVMGESRTYRWDLAGEEGPSSRNDHDGSTDDESDARAEVELERPQWQQELVRDVGVVVDLEVVC